MAGKYHAGKGAKEHLLLRKKGRESIEKVVFTALSS
jgi:hypothetical protein